jgi:hypothetical protein
MNSLFKGNARTALTQVSLGVYGAKYKRGKDGGLVPKIE